MMSDLMKLKSLFLEQDEIAFLYDCESVGEWLLSKGVPSFHIDSSFSASNLISIQTSLHHYLKISELVWERGACALTVPLLSFDASLGAVIYTCEQMSQTDFEDAYYIHEKIMNELSMSSNPITIRSEAIDLSCAFSDNVHYVYPKTCAMQKEEQLRSVLECLEIHFEHTNLNLPPDYQVNGSLMIDGILCACSPNKLEIKNSDLDKKSRDLIHKIALSNQVWLEIKSNVVVKLTIDDKDCTVLLEQLVGEKHGLNVTELAFGLNRKMRKSVNWLINSPINEGARGIHIGLGDGVSGMHIDLISCDLDLPELLKKHRISADEKQINLDIETCSMTSLKESTFNGD